MRLVRWASIVAAFVAAVSLDAQPSTGSGQGPARPAPAAGPAAPQLEQLKQNVGLEGDGMQENIPKRKHSVVSFAELRFPEIETTKFPTNILRPNGLTLPEG